MPQPDGQVLASKDATLFRQLAKFYETKQYKKGIKAADQVHTAILGCPRLCVRPELRRHASNACLWD